MPCVIRPVAAIMIIRQLNIKNLRVVEDIELEPGKGINLITGNNGAGKTTILESIFLLGRGRSFRHKEAGPFIRNGSDSCQVMAVLEDEFGNKHRLGLVRGARDIKVRKDHKDLNKRSELMQTLPIQIITPQSHELIERGPETRRRFLDQNMFHVEHGYYQLITSYNKNLKQRNAALRNRDIQSAHAFNAQLSNLGDRITETRKNYINILEESLKRLLDELKIPFDIDLLFKQGWEKGKSLGEILKQREGIDLKYGFTTAGVHRADIEFRSEGKEAAKRLSRGQQKLLVYLLQIANFQIITGKEEGVTPVFLVDDIGAELDEVNLQKMMAKFSDLCAQVFISTTGTGFISGIPNKMFHVEHGTIRAVND